VTLNQGEEIRVKISIFKNSAPNNPKMNRWFFLIFTSLGPTVYGQSAYVPAYFVNANGDTVRGEARMNPKKEFDNYYKVTFRDANGQQKTYKPEKIKGFGFHEDHYVTITEDDESLFYKVLARGPITLYKFMYEGTRMNKPFFVPEYYLSVPDRKQLVLVKETKFRKQMEEWMDDDPELLATYNDDNEFDPQKAAMLINQYNAWKATQHK
jgi:hypothetical protein